MEEVSKCYPYRVEEKECKQHFDNTVIRDKNGRFIVQLPFRDDTSKLGTSYEIAKRCLIATERRLAQNLNLIFEYSKLMTEYKLLGYMELISDNEENKNVVACYLPHHAVINKNSSTTKVRVVQTRLVKRHSV
jgi:hypothetical protein